MKIHIIKDYLPNSNCRIWKHKETNELSVSCMSMKSLQNNINVKDDNYERCSAYITSDTTSSNSWRLPVIYNGKFLIVENNKEYDYYSIISYVGCQEKEVNDKIEKNKCDYIIASDNKICLESFMTLKNYIKQIDIFSQRMIVSKQHKLNEFSVTESETFLSIVF